MCGIGGWAAFQDSQGKVLSKDTDLDKFISDLVVCNTIRGEDSTGIYGYDLTKNQYYLDKKLVPGYEFEKFFVLPNRISEWQIVLTHNRKATIGAIDTLNAHPLIYKNCVLTHNGTLTRYHHIKHKEMTDIETASRSISDSMILSYMLGNYTLSSFLEEFGGAYALAYHYVNDPKKLYLARNDERNLSICRVKVFPYKNKKDWDGIVWASEGHMLNWLLDRHNIKHEDPTELEPHKLYTVNLERGSFMKTELPQIDTFESRGSQQAYMDWHTYPFDDFRQVQSNSRRSNRWNHVPNSHHNPGIRNAKQTSSYNTQDVTPFEIKQKILVSLCNYFIDDEGTVTLWGDIEFPKLGHQQIQRHIKLYPGASMNITELSTLMDKYFVTKVKGKCVHVPHHFIGKFPMSHTYVGDSDFWYICPNYLMNQFQSKALLREASKDGIKQHARDYASEQTKTILNKTQNNEEKTCILCNEPILDVRNMSLLSSIEKGIEVLEPAHIWCIDGNYDTQEHPLQTLH